MADDTLAMASGPVRVVPAPAPAHERPTPVEGPTSVSIRLFDADRTDRAITLEEALRDGLGDRQLLWIDLGGRSDPQVIERIADRFELKPRTRSILCHPTGGSHIALHGAYFHVRIATLAEDDPSEEPRWLDLLASGNVVLTNHRAPVALLEQLDERIETDATVGAIDGAAFVAIAVDAAVTSYFAAVDAIEEEVDALDGKALLVRAHDDVLADLVRLRRGIARLRRVLTSQRAVFAVFATPDFKAVAPDDDSDVYQAVAARFQDALQSVEDSRDSLLGSFDVFMTRTAQRTNEVMKVLTLATVLLLPGSLIAGLMGMNVDVPVSKDDPMSFWLVVGAIVALSAAVLALARLRRWI
jgi:Mg2+ and Co2+ transporter CorA